MSISINNGVNSNYENTTGKALKTGAVVGLTTAAGIKLAPTVKDTVKLAKKSYNKSMKGQQTIIDTIGSKLKKTGQKVADWLKNKTNNINNLNADNIAENLRNKMTKEPYLTRQQNYTNFVNKTIDAGKKAAIKDAETTAKILENGAPMKRIAIKDAAKEVGAKISGEAKGVKDNVVGFWGKVVKFFKSGKKDKLNTITSKGKNIREDVVNKGKQIRKAVSSFVKADNKIAFLKEHSAQIKKVGIPALIIAGTTIAATAVTKAILDHKAKKEEE